MKYLIAGLGNMDKAYFGTRHNVGFDALDTLAARLNVSFASGTLAHWSQASYKGRTLVLIKPTTYMNLSGKAVRYWLAKEKIEASHLLVILDDLNLEFGKIRIRPQGSDGGHNGLKDIQAQLLSTNYARLRIGIGNEFPKGRQVDYVLGHWSKEQAEALPKILDWSVEAILSFCFQGLGHAMNTYNSKSALSSE